MTDGHDTVPAIPAQGSAPGSPGSMSASATAAYTRIYEEQHPRLVAYARSLTRNAWAAEDLVAEAHFRVWRRLSAGHEIENVPAYLMTTVRHLAATVGSAARETPQDLTIVERVESGAGVGLQADDPADPAEQVSSVDLLVRVLGQLPERWVQALWLAEAEGQPLETVGQRIGAKQGATAVLLHRAREGMRQAFLREQPGALVLPVRRLALRGRPACRVPPGAPVRLVRLVRRVRPVGTVVGSCRMRCGSWPAVGRRSSRALRSRSARPSLPPPSRPASFSARSIR
ncbi:RNA polymerase sigma factor [Streptomyces ipomoeae]|uniref:RNA polymerase sigma factor n=1 Tax=Streptomyces ipomoeae TaxID=103232 RepID=UPI0029A5906D|nr:sigma-70 family RNA polymerase sigma factor [Streptomyces ipomoeae]MDX2700665.1 sigma-70 family RNA polymerase sigma factor [Streptomyces ipomoeae]